MKATNFINLKFFCKDSDCFCQKRSQRASNRWREKGEESIQEGWELLPRNCRGRGGEGMRGQEPRKVEMLGRELPEDPGVHRRWGWQQQSFPSWRTGRSPALLQTLETMLWLGGWGGPQRTLQEGITPFSKAPKAVPGLLGIGTTCVFQPFSKEVFIFL